ncbi:Formate-dependent nitrite reductase, membrane component [Dermatophilus congolensis]|uniref:Formate-dependent nitrite reductase, membrane component n=1 Tax=Dermatophilus congolensis TaxID=1863 RepID=A0AA46H153_9MICO|nr:NrfD/PsrC family molybdoenzyme membrane anchor subunit [Dermatophilus congolensis]STD13481.1 Formate-dependent nitrite reductase, membrane component [Dermatophilus congolensis]
MTTNPFDEVRPPTPQHRGGRRKKRRGADPNATVPEAQFGSYYGRNIVKPPPWKKEIPAYLFLGGLAGASGLIGAGAHLTGRFELRRNARLAAIAAAAAGGAALVVDLGRPERFLNMMRTVKLTSPMSVGSWILVGFSTFAGGAVMTELGRPALASSEPNMLKSLVQAVSGSAQYAAEHSRGLVPPTEAPLVLAKAHEKSALLMVLDFFDPLMSAGTAFFSPPLAAYTAVLLADTAVPLWNQAYRELPFLFVASATAAGCGMAMVTTNPAQTAPVRQLAAIAAGVEAGADVAMERRLGEEGQPLHEGASGRLHTAARVLTVAGGIGAVLCGRGRLGAAVSGLALMAGSACTRFAVVSAGITSAQDPIYTVRPQRRRAAARQTEGMGVTQPGQDIAI